MKRLVIVPTYNESQNIGRILEQILALKELFDVLVIDDNSPDGTAQTVKEIALKIPRVHLVERSSKLGLGTAYIAGFRWALERGYSRIYTMDADFSHQPDYLQYLDGELEEAALAIGSRYIKGGKIVGWPIARKLISRCGNFYARMITGLPFRDCTSGFMAMKREVVMNFLSGDVRTEGYSFLIELKFTGWKSGFRVNEYPIVFSDRAAGKSKISKKIILEAFFLAWKLRMKGAFGKTRGNAFFKAADRFVGIPVVFIMGLFTGKEPAPDGDPKSIAVIKLSAMGDTVLLTPALLALKKKYPGAKIDAVCTDINKAVFSKCGCVDDVIVLDVKGLFRNPLRIFSVFSKKYDVSLDFDQWLRLSPVLSLLSGAGRRYGFRTKNQFRHYIYTAFVEHSKDRHEVESFLDVAGLMGAEGSGIPPRYPVTEKEMEKAVALTERNGIRKDESFIVIHPETPAHGVQRQWPAGSFVRFAKMMVEKYNVKVFVTGTRQDLASNSRIAAAIGSEAVVLEPLDIDEYAAVISRARLFVSSNTGVMHLACALGVPVIGIHGPTSSVKWGPRGEKCVSVKSELKCSPCLYLGFEYGCSRNRCMEAVRPERVFGAAGELLKTGK
ncbi:MAG: glycosyltransferase [Endomicrobiales bacterium]|nr:glycosyltransferase [Endomicrobiales bacterium]